jgi:hypothetical protein
MSEELPLFPLHAVLFPGGRLELRIFEPRYLDMVGRCIRDGGSFGVCLIEEGSEAGAPPTFVPVGTSARILDWAQRADGLLGITASGVRRFRVIRSRVQPDNLVVGEVEWLVEPEAEPLGSEHAWLRELLVSRAHGSVADGAPAASDTAELGFRLAERMPLPLPARQQLLEMDAPAARLGRIAAMLQPLVAAPPRDRFR